MTDATYRADDGLAQAVPIDRTTVLLARLFAIGESLASACAALDIDEDEACARIATREFAIQLAEARASIGRARESIAADLRNRADNTAVEAFDTVRMLMHTGKEKIRLAAAKEILERAPASREAFGARDASESPGGNVVINIAATDALAMRQAMISVGNEDVARAIEGLAGEEGTDE